MNKVKAYFDKQASRPALDLVSDFVVLGSVITCVFFGWIN